MESSLFSEKNQQFAKQLNDIVVPLIAHKSEKKLHNPVDVKDPKTKEVKSLCTKYFGISCDDHEKVYGDMAGKLNLKSSPSTFILNPDLSVGKQLVSSEQSSEKATIDAIKEVQKKLGKGLVGEAWTSVQKHQKEAEKAIEKEKYDKAVYELKSIKSMDKKIPDAYTKYVDDKLGEINQKGEELLSKALENGDAKAKEKAIKEVVNIFRGLDVEKKAKEELDKLKESK